MAKTEKTTEQEKHLRELLAAWRAGDVPPSPVCPPEA